MKKHIVLAVMALAIILTACSSTGTTKPSPTTAVIAPEAGFVSPAAGQILPAGKTSVVVQATATGGVARIELSVNGIVVTTGENPDPSKSYFVLVYDWEPPVGGDYSLQARAQNKAGVWGAQAALQVTVTTPDPTAKPAVEEEATPTPTEQPTAMPTALIGPGPSPTPTTQTQPTSSGFTVRLQIFRTSLYVADSPCEPQTILFMATASDPAQVAGIYMAFRIHDPESSDKRGWTSGTPMITGTNGKFILYLTTRYIWNPIPWIPANVDYQFYASDYDGNVLYRSEIFRDMRILKCTK